MPGLTPQSFYRDYCAGDTDVMAKISLINDPRNEYKRLYTVDKLNNMVGGGAPQAGGVKGVFDPLSIFLPPSILMVEFDVHLPTLPSFWPQLDPLNPRTPGTRAPSPHSSPAP